MSEDMNGLSILDGGNLSPMRGSEYDGSLL